MPLRRFGPYTVETSNEDKLLFDDPAISKGALMDYYESVAAHFIRHATDRPLTMQRFPDGINEDGFFQKQIGDYFPGWIDRAVVATEDGEQEQVVCNNKATLVYLANQACITPHVFASRTDRLDVPDRLVIDLDPPGEDFGPVRRAAKQCKRLLDELELNSFVKTTGSRGLHVVVPLRRECGFDVVRKFARSIASLLASRHCEELTIEQRKSKRRGRLYLDVGRNAYGQTTVATYAIRALAGAPVATPIDWCELDDHSLTARSFDLKSVPRRIAKSGDAWHNLARSAQSLPAASRRLDSLLARA